MRKKRIFSFLASVIFFIVFVISVVLFFSSNISELNALHFGISQIRYMPLLYTLTISSLLVACVFLILYLIIKIKYCDVNTKLFAVLCVAVIIGYSCPVISQIVTAQSAFTEMTINGDKDRPDANYIQFFPYYDLLFEKSENYPYYFLSKYTIDNSTYVSSQNYVFTDGHEDSLSVNVDYFETDSKYLMNRYHFEKSFFYSADENGNEIEKTQINHESKDGLSCDVICLKTQKRMIIQNESYYFTLSIVDPENDFNMDKESFIDFGYRELELLQQFAQ